jgi:hypothetical protein
VCVWVDDIILASGRDKEQSRLDFDAALRIEFEMSPWTSGEASWILNMKVQRDWVAGTLHLSQPGAIEKLATQFGLTGLEKRAPWVPMDPHLKLTKPGDDCIVPTSVWDYQSAVGGLLYLSLTARPDIAQSVGVLSRFMSCPGEAHVEATSKLFDFSMLRKIMGSSSHAIKLERRICLCDLSRAQAFLLARGPIVARLSPTDAAISLVSLLVAT